MDSKRGDGVPVWRRRRVGEANAGIGANQETYTMAFLDELACQGAPDETGSACDEELHCGPF